MTEATKTRKTTTTKKFPWNVAKSAVAMFSRWAVKRVCKFLLKKKLGKFILGDVHLDQLEVQLSDGPIQLNDLALNVDYINKKLEAEEYEDFPLMLFLPVMKGRVGDDEI